MGYMLMAVALIGGLAIAFLGWNMGYSFEASLYVGMVVSVVAWLALRFVKYKDNKAKLEAYAQEKGYAFDFVEQPCYGVDLDRKRIVFNSRGFIDIPFSDIVNVGWRHEDRGPNNQSYLDFTIKNIEQPKVSFVFPGKSAETKFARLQAAGIIQG